MPHGKFDGAEDVDANNASMEIGISNALNNSSLVSRRETQPDDAKTEGQATSPEGW